MIRQQPIQFHMLAFAAAIYLLLAFCKINQPITDDEIYEIENAERIIEGCQIDLFVPPLYDLLLAGSIRVFGREPWAFRIIGLVSGVAALAALAAILLRLGVSSRDPRSWLALLLLAVNPAFIQGSLLVHIDNTILVPLLAWWLYFSLGYFQDGGGIRLLAGSICFAAALLAKFSTPLLVLPAAMIFGWIRHRHRFYIFLTGMMVGITLFLLAWLGMAAWMQLDFASPFLGAGQRGTLYLQILSGDWRPLTANIIFLCVWFTPWLLLAAMFSLSETWHNLHHQHWSGDVLLPWLATISGFAYLVISTINHGFPKYFIPALPFLIAAICVSAGEPLEPLSSRRLAMMTLTVLAGGVLVACFMPDPVYFVRYSVRVAQATGGSIDGLHYQAGFLLAFWLTPVAGWLCTRMLKLSPWLSIKWFALVMALCFAFGQSLRQAVAPYQTNYSYGERGTAEVVQFIRQSNLASTARIVTTKDILYSLGRRGEYLPKETWSKPEALFEALNDAPTQIMVVSLPAHSVTTIQAIRNNVKISNLLASEYQQKQIGSHIICMRQRKFPQ